MNIQCSFLLLITHNPSPQLTDMTQTYYVHTTALVPSSIRMPNASKVFSFIPSCACLAIVNCSPNYAGCLNFFKSKKYLLLDLNHDLF